jgi:serine/threonine protein kinase
MSPKAPGKRPTPRNTPVNDDPLIGRKLSNFVVKRVLGRGGMAQVYYGEDVKLQRPVAIKVIDVRFRNKPAYAQRFVKEARAVAGWRHENIIQIYYADDQDGFFYYAMEYIDGDDLSSLMSSYAIKGKLMPAEEVVRIGRAVANALDYAHKKGIIHRDIKPSNILLSKEGRVVLSDFGLALDMQEGSSGEAFGTPHYISPEQARRSTDATPESDLYSLGVMLYEMLTGVVPFDDASPTNVALQHITQPPPPPRSINPQLSVETENVLLKALSKKPKERYSSGAELMDALGKTLSGTKASEQRVLPLPPMPAAIVAGKSRGVTQRPPQPPPTKAAPKRRWPVVLFLFVVLLAGLFYFRDKILPAWFDPSAFIATTTYTPAPTFTATNPPPSPEVTIRVPPTAIQLPVDLPINSATPKPVFTATTAHLVEPVETFTFTPSPTLKATKTIAPTEVSTNTAAPSATSTKVAAVETATLEASPGPSPSPTTTQQYANYRRMWLYYDSYGIYLYNASGATRSASAFAFERLDTSGNTSNRFDGYLWADYYPNLTPGRCMRIEIQKNPNSYLNPTVCKNRYLSDRSFTKDSNLIFWTPLPDSTQFRVLWQDKEVAVCENSAGFCEFFVP